MRAASLRLCGLLLSVGALAACGNNQQVGVYNSPPAVSLISPPDGAEYEEGDAIAFEALVEDDFDDPATLQIRWASDVDGELGVNSSIEQGVARLETANLTGGHNHVVSLTAVDSDGESASDSVTVTIFDLPDAPELTVIHPVSGETGVEDEEFEFVVQVSDTSDPPQSLLVEFESDYDGVFCQPTPDKLGVASCEQVLSLVDDYHTVTFTVSDSEGFVTRESVVFTITAGSEIDNDGDGFTEAQGDCDDGDSSVSPIAEEFYNGRDDDCDGIIDNGTEAWDDDGDGWSEIDGDCDDLDPSINPDAIETCDSADEDCDGEIDEDTPCTDDDGDGWTDNDGDCDDPRANTTPAATEIEDGDDNDCDGIIDEGTDAYDDDGDGYTEYDGDCDDADGNTSPAGTEVCGDGIDNDCNGSADDESAVDCSTYYYDYDGDGYGDASTSKCLCGTSGYYTTNNATDCYDQNGDANPTQINYFSTHRGDSSYDYNCDSSEAQYYTASYSCDCDWSGFSCDSYTSGYSGSAPSCGSNGTWESGCDCDWWSCDNTSSSTVTQICN